MSRAMAESELVAIAQHDRGVLDTVPRAHQPNSRAIALWREGRPPIDTPVERYLRKYRGIEIPLPPIIRCGRGPSMLGAVQDANGTLIAVQSTRLTREG